MAFDTLFALPRGIPNDLYREHQAVWALVQRVSKHCTQFQYRIEHSPTGVLVRLRTLNRVCGAVSVSLPASGAIELRIACARRADGKMIGVVDDTAFDQWFTSRALQSGIAIQDLSFSPLRYIRGVKQHHQIVIPVRDVYGNYSLLDPIAATTTFESGLGRARRFGCGMLVTTNILKR